MDFRSDREVGIEVGERVFPVEIIDVSGGRSSVRLKNGRVVLKVSRFLRGKKRDEVVEKFVKWARKKLSAVEVVDFVSPSYRDGGYIVTHNRVYSLRIFFEERKRSRTVVTDGAIELFLPSDLEDVDVLVRNLVDSAIIKDQSQYLIDVVEELNALFFREKINLIRFKRMTSRFGSCSSKRNINIAYRLLFAPREVFRYVCVHELSHLKEFNHSARFWELVEGAMPDYKVQEKWLKSNGFMLG